MKDSFFKIKTFKSLKEVMESFCIMKNFQTVMVSLFSIKNFKNHKKVKESFFNNFKSRKKVTESFLQY